MLHFYFLEIFSFFFYFQFLSIDHILQFIQSPMEQQEKESKIAANVDQIPKGLSLYIGNLTWVNILTLKN